MPSVWLWFPIDVHAILHRLAVVVMAELLNAVAGFVHLVSWHCQHHAEVARVLETLQTHSDIWRGHFTVMVDCWTTSLNWTLDTVTYKSGHFTVMVDCWITSLNWTLDTVTYERGHFTVMVDCWTTSLNWTLDTVTYKSGHFTVMVGCWTSLN